MVMYFIANANENTTSDLNLIAVEQATTIREQEAVIASKTRELDWAYQYMNKLETRILELHRVMDKLVEESKMRDISNDPENESCDDCTFPDCQKCPEVPDLALVDIDRPYTL